MSALDFNTKTMREAAMAAGESLRWPFDDEIPY